mgnify:CR=1 FL=1
MIEYVIGFITGLLVSYLLTYIMALGHAVFIIKQIQQSCAALFIVSEQGLLQILELKYIAMKEAKRTEQNIIAQKYIDQMNIDSIKNTVMKNYTKVFPEKYVHVMEYSTWEEMEEYVNKALKGNNHEE